MQTSNPIKKLKPQDLNFLTHFSSKSNQKKKVFTQQIICVKLWFFT